MERRTCRDRTTAPPTQLTSPGRRDAGRRRFGLLALLLVLGVLLLGGEAALSYYVDALWFGSLGYGDVFWKTAEPPGRRVRGAGAVTFGRSTAPSWR